MEKITDNDLKEMLTKPEEQKEEPEVIVNEETGEVQWVKIDKDTPFEETPMYDAITSEQKEENLEEQLEQDIDFNKIPENIETNDYEEVSLDPILEQRKELAISLSPKDLKDAMLYATGNGVKPIFIDRFTSDAEGRLRDIIMMITQIQLSKIPTLTALYDQLLERMFSPQNLYDMDSKVLSGAMANIGKDIQMRLDGSVKALQVVNQTGSLNNKYRNLIDNMIMLPPDKLELLEQFIFDDKIEK